MKTLIKELGELYNNTPNQLNQLSAAQVVVIREIITAEYEKIRLNYNVVFESGNKDLEDFDKIKARLQKTGVLAISSDFNNSDLLGKEVNLHFRAWHDYLHITNDFPFGFVGEFNTFLKHIDGYEDVAGLVEVLFSEVVLQTAYFETYGEFYEEQKMVLPHYQYVSKCIERFLDESEIELYETDFVAFDNEGDFLSFTNGKFLVTVNEWEIQELGYEPIPCTKLTYSKKSELIKNILANK